MLIIIIMIMIITVIVIAIVPVAAGRQPAGWGGQGLGPLLLHIV